MGLLYLNPLGHPRPVTGLLYLLSLIIFFTYGRLYECSSTRLLLPIAETEWSIEDTG
jgi:hypothetical protein